MTAAAAADTGAVAEAVATMHGVAEWATAAAVAVAGDITEGGQGEVVEAAVAAGTEEGEGMG